jgi:triacylglycerol esterase/lipase EstA (alpha/beta hydrolase family)
MTQHPDMAIKMLREDEVSPAPPPKLFLLLESRAALEFGHLLLTRNKLRQLPRGDGHPVLFVPGFGATDGSMRVMRKIFSQLGYSTYGWGLGRNVGMNKRIKEGLSRRLEEIFTRHGQKVTLIGWSLGGVYVREMARASPQLVRRVITLGSPINGHPEANNVSALFHFVNRNKKINLDWDGFQKRRIPPPVPCTAISSKTDGIVAWRCSQEEPAPNTENVKVVSSHFGLAVNAQVIKVVAERLAKI